MLHPDMLNTGGKSENYGTSTALDTPSTMCVMRGRMKRLLHQEHRSGACEWKSAPSDDA